jgi:hypothetical protein
LAESSPVTTASLTQQTTPVDRAIVTTTSHPVGRSDQSPTANATSISVPQQSTAAVDAMTSTVHQLNTTQAPQQSVQFINVTTVGQNPVTDPGQVTTTVPPAAQSTQSTTASGNSVTLQTRGVDNGTMIINSTQAATSQQRHVALETTSSIRYVDAETTGTTTIFVSSTEQLKSASSAAMTTAVVNLEPFSTTASNVSSQSPTSKLLTSSAAGLEATVANDGTTAAVFQPVTSTLGVSSSTVDLSTMAPTTTNTGNYHVDAYCRLL